MILGFEHESYSISEGNGSVEVCVQVKNGISQSSLRLSLATMDGDATGNYTQIIKAVYTASVIMIKYFLLLSFNMYCTLFTIASADYTSKSVDLMFGSSNNKRCVVIPVLNDTVPEDPEHFSVVVSMTTPLAGVILTPDNATVVINDDDGEYQ